MVQHPVLDASCHFEGKADFSSAGSKFSLLRPEARSTSISSSAERMRNLRTASIWTIVISARLFCLCSEGSLCSAVTIPSSGKWDQQKFPSDTPWLFGVFHGARSWLQCPGGNTQGLGRWHQQCNGVCRWLHDVLFLFSSWKGEDLELGCSSSPGLVLLQSPPMIFCLPYAFKRRGKSSS